MSRNEFGSTTNHPSYFVDHICNISLNHLATNRKIWPLYLRRIDSDLYSQNGRTNGQKPGYPILDTLDDNWLRDDCIGCTIKLQNRFHGISLERNHTIWNFPMCSSAIFTLQDAKNTGDGLTVQETEVAFTAAMIMEMPFFTGGAEEILPGRSKDPTVA